MLAPTTIAGSLVADVDDVGLIVLTIAAVAEGQDWGWYNVILRVYFPSRLDLRQVSMENIIWWLVIYLVSWSAASVDR